MFIQRKTQAVRSFLCRWVATLRTRGSAVVPNNKGDSTMGRRGGGRAFGRLQCSRRHGGLVCYIVASSSLVQGGTVGADKDARLRRVATSHRARVFTCPSGRERPVTGASCPAGRSNRRGNRAVCYRISLLCGDRAPLLYGDRMLTPRTF